MQRDTHMRDLRGMNSHRANTGEQTKACLASQYHQLQPLRAISAIASLSYLLSPALRTLVSPVRLSAVEGY